jgi:hypothetical protein
MSESEHQLEVAEEKVVKKKAAYNFAKILLVGFAGMALATVLTLQTSLLIQQQKFDEVGQETRTRLLDCTDPNGQCYKDGQARSGAIVKSLNDNQKTVVTIAAYCAKQPVNQTLEQIEACVNKELAR